MKNVILFTVFIVFATLFAFGQRGTTYDIHQVFKTQNGNYKIEIFTTQYYDGNTWLFMQTYNHFLNSYNLTANVVDIDNNGQIQLYDEWKSPDYFFDPNTEIKSLTSCLHSANMFVFWLERDGDDYLMGYNMWEPGAPDWYHREVDFPGKTERQIAAEVVNDTLFVFYVDEEDHRAKYFMGTFKYSKDNKEAPLIEWTTTYPLRIDVVTEITALGNVDACTYQTDKCEEKILVTIATIENGNNDLKVYSGPVPGSTFFNYPDNSYTPDNYPAKNVAIEQGSVQNDPDFQHKYVFQVVYNTESYENGKGPVRITYDLENGFFQSNYEEISLEQEETIYDNLNVGLMEYYVKHDTKREKHLYQLYVPHLSPNTTLKAIHWESDQLIYIKTDYEVAPVANASEFWDLIVVAEGSPPYALNGWSLADQCIHQYPPSIFKFFSQTSNSLSTTTTYTQSPSISAGIGPVTFGFKATFLEGHSTTTTKTLEIGEIIKPPYDSSYNYAVGRMWYFYVAPTIKRDVWRLCDWSGDTISPERNLCFFEFESANLKSMDFSLSNYSHSPRANDLHSYENRNLANMPGMQPVIREECDIDIKAGGTSYLDLTFSTTHTESHSQSYEPYFNVSGKGKIFSGSIGLKAKFAYSRNRTSTYKQGFYITWSNPGPKNPEDSSNISHYSPVSYIMRTDTNAYFLLEGFKNYKPYFITYEVEDIEHGPFNLSVDENQINKYHFSVSPNPCYHSAVFSWKTDKPHIVNLQIYNLQGVMIDELKDFSMPAGKQSYTAETGNYPPGIYVYKFMIDNDIFSGKLIKQ